MSKALQTIILDLKQLQNLRFLFRWRIVIYRWDWNPWLARELRSFTIDVDHVSTCRHLCVSVCVHTRMCVCMHACVCPEPWHPITMCENSPFNSIITQFALDVTLAHAHLSFLPSLLTRDPSLCWFLWCLCSKVKLINEVFDTVDSLPQRRVRLVGWRFIIDD